MVTLTKVRLVTSHRVLLISSYELGSCLCMLRDYSHRCVAGLHLNLPPRPTTLTNLGPSPKCEPELSYVLFLRRLLAHITKVHYAV